MSADIIKIEYEKLDEISRQFAQAQKNVQRVAQLLSQTTDRLRGGGWIADAATVFYRDLDNTVFPRLNRLAAALGRSEQAMIQIMKLFALAEDEAAAHIGNATTGAGGGGTGHFPQGIPGIGVGAGGLSFASQFFTGGSYPNGSIPGFGTSQFPFHLMSGMQMQSYSGVMAGNLTADQIKGFISNDPFKPKLSDYVDASANLWKAETAGGVAVWEGTLSGQAGSIKAGVLGVDYMGSAKFGIVDGGIGGEVEVGASAYLAQVTATTEIAGGQATVHGMIGATARGEMGAAFNPFNGEVSGKVEAEAFAGGKLTGEYSKEIGPATIGAQGAVTYGVGAKFKGDVGLDNGVMKFQLQTGLTFGLGLEGGVKFELDVKKAADVAVDAGKQALDYGESMWKKINPFD